MKPLLHINQHSSSRFYIRHNPPQLYELWIGSWELPGKPSKTPFLSSLFTHYIYIHSSLPLSLYLTGQNDRFENRRRQKEEVPQVKKRRRKIRKDSKVRERGTLIEEKKSRSTRSWNLTSATIGSSRCRRSSTLQNYSVPIYRLHRHFILPLSCFLEIRIRHFFQFLNILIYWWYWRNEIKIASREFNNYVKISLVQIGAKILHIDIILHANNLIINFIG